LKTHLIEELIEKFNVYEHSRSICEFVSDDVEEGFRTKNIIGWTCSTPFRFEGHESKLEDVQPSIAWHSGGDEDSPHE
jgi:hypothetical protein